MPERYGRLKDTAHARIQEMIDYVTEEDQCRSRFLLKYFGQEESSDCGTCDICRDTRSRLDDLRDKLDND